MGARRESEHTSMKNITTVEKKSEREARAGLEHALGRPDVMAERVAQQGSRHAAHASAPVGLAEDRSVRSVSRTRK